MKQFILQVVLDTPLDSSFDYRWQTTDEAEPIPQNGQLVHLSFGWREVVGMIVGSSTHSEVPPAKLKNVEAVRYQLSPLSPRWLTLCRFAADYYQRPLGEVALPGLPKNLRTLTTVALDRGLKKLNQMAKMHDATPINVPPLNPSQQFAVDVIAGTTGFAPTLLYGVTGSGKTEVYLQAAAKILVQSTNSNESNPAQILILVPEINLTPQLEENIRARFPGLMVATLHSGLAEGERMHHWLAAHLGHARIILGTRLAVLASLPHLRLIVVDEEHDPSYKQQEGLRYSARDLAVWRAHQLSIPIVMGSATPSLETWQHVQLGHYRKLELRERAVMNAVLPEVRLVNMEHDKPTEGLTSTLMNALRLRLQRGEQSLLFLNRRGYAPVIACDACGWVSNCTRCTAFMVLHKPEHRLRCHHCSLELRIPKSCPTCGNVDLQPLGRGTQRLEEGLCAMFPEARVLRIDADSTRRKGSAQSAFDLVHRGEIDILIGTQM
ncbi:MAG: primosomal protein N', partial [Glaciimonas sp.]|nr:primosomal protein N' [Glaciimonas sp.]